MEPANNPAGILAIAGGGTRGVVPGAQLEYIAREEKVDPKALFSFKAGTSIGSIIAGGLSLPGNHTITDINQILKSTLPKVFAKPSLISRIFHLGYAFSNEYGAGPLQNGLQAQFGNTPFSAATNPLLVISTRTNPFRGYRFISDQPSPYPNLTFTQVLRASSAAPTYLPGYFLTNNQGAQDEFVDGGMSGANDPTNVAQSYFSRRIPLSREVVILSLQTGKCDLALPKSSARWGWLSWVGCDNEALITGLFDTMISNTADIVEDWQHSPSLKGRSLLILNPVVPFKDDALNNASPEVLDALIDIANIDADHNKVAINELIRKLVP